MCCRIFLYFSVVAMYWYVILTYWSDVLVRCVHALMCDGYLFLSRGESDVLSCIDVCCDYNISVCCDDVIMFVVVNCKLIWAKMRYLFILLVMCNTEIVFILKQLSLSNSQLNAVKVYSKKWSIHTVATI
jgi:hypothetical protein